MTATTQERIAPSPRATTPKNVSSRRPAAKKAAASKSTAPMNRKNRKRRSYAQQTRSKVPNGAVKSAMKSKPNVSSAADKKAENKFREQAGIVLQGLHKLEGLNVLEYTGAWFGQHYETVKQDPQLLKAAELLANVAKTFQSTLEQIRSRTTNIQWPLTDLPSVPC